MSGCRRCGATATICVDCGLWMCAPCTRDNAQCNGAGKHAHGCCCFVKTGETISSHGTGSANSICTSRQRHIGPPLSPVSQPPPRVQSWSPLPVTSVLPAFSKSGMIDSRTGSIDSGKNTHYGYNAIVALFPQAATPTTSVQRGQLPASSLGRLLNPRPRGEKNLASHCSHHGAKATVAGGESGRTTTSHQTLRSFQAAPYHRRNRAPRTRTRASH